jgi:uncharacterized protein YcgI (DUF1989 family)
MLRDDPQIAGSAVIVPSPPLVGSIVVARAESRGLTGVSNCPQTHNPCNGFNFTPIRVIVRTG